MLEEEHTSFAAFFIAFFDNGWASVDAAAVLLPPEASKLLSRFSAPFIATSSSMALMLLILGTVRRAQADCSK